MIKKTLLASSILMSMISVAGAADVDTTASFDWTGPYVGVHAGYGVPSFDGAFDTGELPTREDVTYPDDINADGFIGGGQIGYNHQIDDIVLGVEADISFTDFSGDTVDDQDDIVEAKLNYLASLRARAGFALDNILLYATGGVALANGKFKVIDDADDPDDVESFNEKIDEWGYVVGGGVEWAATEMVSLRVEGLYYGFDHKINLNEDLPDVDEDDYLEFNDVYVVRAGVNLRF